MSQKLTTDIFIQRSREVHGDVYDYSKTKYENSTSEVCIICPEHGEFLLRANTHLRGYGCPKCEEQQWCARRNLRHNLEKGGMTTLDFPTTFVAIDFETFYSDPLSACSVGMVKYQDGMIVDKYNSLICPPWDVDYKEDKAAEVHHLKKEDVESARTMVEVLPEIERFVENLPLVAHHAATESNCFCKTCNYYNISTSIDYDHILDTQFLSSPIEILFGKKTYKGKGSHELTTLCRRFNVPVLIHHQSSDDAEMCGNLFLQLGKVFRKEITIEFKDETFINAQSATSSSQSKTIRPKSSIIPEQTPFYGKTVVVSGFPTVDKEAYKQAVRDMGGKVTTEVSGKTNLLVCGPVVGPEKLKKAHSLGTSLMDKEEFLSFLDIY